MAPARASTGGRRDVARWAADRFRYLDNLKTLVVAGVIVMHGCIGYVAGQGWWPYAVVQETQLSGAATAALFALVGPLALFMMALLFLVAGLLSGPSLQRKGPAQFARDRLVRLGIPFAVMAFVVWPLVLVGLSRAFLPGDEGFWPVWWRQFGDAGPLWFVGLLLLVSLGLAGWRALVPAPARSSRPLSTRSLVVLAAAIALVTFLLRLTYAYGSTTPLHLNEWQWPECVGLFGLGVCASRRDWQQRVPDHTWRASVWVLVVSAAGAVVLALLVGVLGVDVNAFLGGWGWPALALAVIEGALTVFGSVWLLGVAQRWLTWRLSIGPPLARSAYGAFIVQGPVLVGWAVVMRNAALPAEVKALLVSVLGVATAFGVTWLMVRRVPLVARIL